MKKSWLLIFILCFGLSAGLKAQLGSSSKRIDGKAKFMPVPYLNYNRSFGFAAGAVPMLMFNPSAKDTISPSSIVGGVGTYASNKTWFLMGFGVFFLDEDNWRITTAGGRGNLFFQFYMDLIGDWVPYQTDGRFFMFRVERRIWKHLYGGLSYNYYKAISQVEGIPLVDSLQIHGIGLNLSLDERDNPHYPRSGFLSNVKYNTFPGFFGNDRVSQKITLEHNHYFSLRSDKDVVAARVLIGVGLGDIGFSQQLVVGNNDIRGYTQGAFRGDQKVAIQGEYRWNFHRRWGAVGFAGLASVFGSINDSDNGKLLPGVGTGIRFRAFPETNFSVGIDVAAGLDDWGISFQIGEAF